ncbi:hypothetical protein GCM10009682_57760 [Luedemannella flava]|uniref:Translation initiation factor n=1 Tax=Luedemannella flava TaxID=349316 RepID=A0ABP4YVD7_9ACTN
MAATRSPAPTLGAGLSTQELETIRDSLANGRKPKVVFTDNAGQMAGQTGQVIELTDPELSDEWVVVRFGRDELPFSPADLAVPPKGTRSAPRTSVPEMEPEQAPPPFMITRDPAPAAVPAPRKEETVAQPTTTAEPTATEAIPAQGGEAKPARKAAAPKAAKAKPIPALTVTLAYADGEWTVGANQGTKAVAKPYVIRPTEALKMVALLDVPAVHEAVEQILAAERSEAEHQAQRLRAELAEVEAKLADLNTR